MKRFFLYYLSILNLEIVLTITKKKIAQFRTDKDGTFAADPPRIHVGGSNPTTSAWVPQRPTYPARRHADDRVVSRLDLPVTSTAAHADGCRRGGDPAPMLRPRETPPLPSVPPFDSALMRSRVACGQRFAELTIYNFFFSFEKL